MPFKYEKRESSSLGSPSFLSTLAKKEAALNIGPGGEDELCRIFELLARALFPLTLSRNPLTP